jgi:pyruvate dehydrogenase E2 component (dihydrolipoamide acetyltransferase)
MAIAVEMPKMSDTMEEGVLVSWLVKEGAEVSAGDIIAQVETDKATMDLEVYDDGVLLKIVSEEGASVPIGGLIAVLGEKGEDISGVLEKYRGDGAPSEKASEPEPASADEEKTASREAPEPSGDGAVSSANGRLKASPLARRMAADKKLDLSGVTGSGPEGRIIKRDIEAALERKATGAPAAISKAPAIKGEGEYEAIPISQMRKTIARRLGESKFTSPHFYLNVDIDMERAMAARASINEAAEGTDRPKVSFNDLIVKACAMALRLHPAVNASWVASEGEMRRYSDIHVAVAVAIDDGLVTPVIRNADRKGLAQIAVESKDLSTRARERKLDLEEMEGSTFTTSNLGMLGIDHFTAIINPPNSCILAIGAIRDVPVVKGGAVVPGKRMTVTLSCDHRIVDGATGARFLATVKQFLEEPTTMLL